MEEVGKRRLRDSATEPPAKLPRSAPSISEMWKTFSPALQGEDRSAFSTAIHWLTGVAQNGTDTERMEISVLLAPCVASLLAQKESHALEEATRALRWLLIEPEDPSLPAPAHGPPVALPSKSRELFLKTPGLIDAIVNAFSYVVTPPIEARLETVKEILSLIVCLCKVDTLAKALWEKNMLPAIAKLCYVPHRKLVIRACWAMTKITKTLQNFVEMGKVALPALIAALHQSDEEIAFAAVSALQSMFPNDEPSIRAFEDQAVIERLVVLARSPTANSLRQRSVLLLASMASLTKQEDWYASLGCLSVFLEAVNEVPDCSHKNCMCRAGLCGLAGLMKPDKHRLRPSIIRMTMNFDSLGSCLSSSSAPCKRDARIMLQWLFRPIKAQTLLELVSTGLVPKIFDLPEAKDWLVPHLKKSIFVDAVYPALDLPANRQLQYRAFLTCLCYESLSRDTNSVEELLIRKKGLEILFNFVHKLGDGRPSTLQEQYEAQAGLRLTMARLAEHPFMVPAPEVPTTPQAAEFHDLVNNPSMHDAELELDDGTVYFAHRVFLVKRSEFFDKMFRSNMVECKQMRIRLRELKGTVLLQLLRYLYCKTLTIQSVDEALALVAAGSRFLVQGIEVPCLSYLHDRITPSSLLEIMAFASTHSSEGLHDLCYSWIIRKYADQHTAETYVGLFKDSDWLSELHVWVEKKLKAYIASAPPAPLSAPAPR